MGVSLDHLTPREAVEQMLLAGARFNVRQRDDEFGVSFTYGLEPGADRERCRALLAAAKARPRAVLFRLQGRGAARRQYGGRAMTSGFLTDARRALLREMYGARAPAIEALLRRLQDAGRPARPGARQPSTRTSIRCGRSSIDFLVKRHNAPPLALTGDTDGGGMPRSARPWSRSTIAATSTSAIRRTATMPSAP